MIEPGPSTRRGRRLANVDVNGNGIPGKGRRVAKASPRKDLVAGELLEQAAALFAERGFAATSLQDIADAMGISRPALYYYIKSKEDLLSQLVEGMTEPIAAYVTELRRSDLPAEEKIATFVRSTVTRIAASAARFRLLDRSEPDLPPSVLRKHEQGKRRVLEHLRGMLAEGVQSGEFRPLDERIVAFSILGTINWVAWWYHEGGGSTIDEVADEMVRMIIAGITRTDGRRPEPGLKGAFGLLREDLSHLERLLGF